MSNKITALSISGLHQPLQITITEEAQQQKARALAVAKPIVKVSSDESQNAAIAVVASLKAITKQTETTRKALKQPFIDAGKELDDKAKKYVADIEAEAKRIEGLVAAFQYELRAKADAERREQEKRIREAQEAEAKAKGDAEELTRKLNAALQSGDSAAASRLEEGLISAEIDAQEAAEDKDAALHATPVKNPVVAGASVQEDFDIDVLDVHALYAAHRQAVKLEPRLSAIRDLIAAGVRDIPGVKLTPKIRVAARAATPGLTLSV